MRIDAAAEDLHRGARGRDPLARPGERAADQVAVAGQALGEAVHHEVGPERERPLQVRARERVVDDHDQAARVGGGRDQRQVDDLERGIGRALDDQHAAALAGDAVDAGQLGERHEPRADPEARQRVGQQAHGPAVERGAAEHLVARLHQREHRARHRRHARGQRERRLRLLERGQPLLEVAHGRVRVARVEEELLVAAEIAAQLVGRGEGEGGGLRDRCGERPRAHGAPPVHRPRSGSPLAHAPPPQSRRGGAAQSPTGIASRYLPSSRSGSGDCPTTGSTN